jgi:flavin reductase (DIM6/NTAB) family NADH-FMN oxidoreductase RutF
MRKNNDIPKTSNFDTMPKIAQGKNMPPMALPICLVGSNVEGKPNFCTIAWFTMIDDEPPTIGIVMAKQRRTKDGIIENGTFSVSIPSTELTVPVDYCGIKSGSKGDKSEVFRTFYGKLKTAPLIEDCPLTMECHLKRIIELEGTDIVVGEIEELYADEGVFRDGRPDPTVLDPLMYLSGGKAYHSLGDRIADAFKVGKSYHKS